jgi:MFS family permease
MSLYTSQMFISIGTGFVFIFLPIFIYELAGHTLWPVAAFFALSSALYMISVPLGAIYFNRFGYRSALRVSALLGGSFLALLVFVDVTNWMYLAPVVVLMLVLYRIFHWVPYHTDYAKFSDARNRGREVSMSEVTAYAAGAGAPVVAGFLISRFGFSVMFVVGMTLYLSSLIPLLYIPRTNERYTWSYSRTWRELLAPRHHRKMFAYMAEGAEGAVGLVVWPIFIFTILKGNYLQVGAISTTVILGTIVFQLAFGRYIDRWHAKERALHWANALYAAGWLLKVFIATAFHIFIIDMYHRLTGMLSKSAYSTIMYDFFSKRGHYVDEHTVLHEMAAHLGIVLMLGAIIVMSLYLPLTWIFILASFAVLFRSLIAART